MKKFTVPERGFGGSVFLGNGKLWLPKWKNMLFLMTVFCINGLTTFEGLHLSGFLQNKKMWSKFSKADEPDSNMAFSGKKKKKQLVSPEPAKGISLTCYLSLVLRTFVEFKWCISLCSGKDFMLPRHHIDSVSWTASLNHTVKLSHVQDPKRKEVQSVAEFHRPKRTHTQCIRCDDRYKILQSRVPAPIISQG